jgi:hypothetical protein
MHLGRGRSLVGDKAGVGRVARFSAHSSSIRKRTGIVGRKAELHEVYINLAGALAVVAVRGALEYTARIPLSDLAPGPYVLNVEARARLGPIAGNQRQRKAVQTVAPTRVLADHTRARVARTSGSNRPAYGIAFERAPYIRA